VSFLAIANIQRVSTMEVTGQAAFWNAVQASLLYVVPYSILIFTDRKWGHVLLTVVGVLVALTLPFALTQALVAE